MNIGIAYGHVASNLGDLAINQGAVTLLCRLFPHATFHVPLLNSNDAHLAAAEASMAHARQIRYYPLRTTEARRALGHDEHNEYAQLMSYTHDHNRFLRDSGLGECDLIFYNSGEHLMAYQGDHRLDTIWRLLPLMAAKARGIRYISLPATAGPFEDDSSSDLMRMYCAMSDALAVREPRSAALIEQLTGQSPPVLLDPAFFVQPPVTAHGHAAGRARLSIVQRLEDFGLRAGTQRSKESLTTLRENRFQTSQAYRCSMALAERYLNASPTHSVSLLVQTQHDVELNEAIAEGLRAQGLGDRVQLEKVATIDEYYHALARSSLVVSSRFHGCIMATTVGVPVVGLYFQSHGHKMPGLFDLLECPQRCFDCSSIDPQQLAESVVGLFEQSDTVVEQVQKRLTALREQTASWVESASKSSQPRRSMALAAMGRGACEIVDHSEDALSATTASEVNLYRESLFSTLQHLRDSASDASIRSSRAFIEARRKLDEQLAEANKELKRAERALAELADRLQESEMTAAEIRLSGSHRLGSFLTKAMRRPWSLPLLPIRLPVWLLLEWRRRRRHTRMLDLRRRWKRGETKCDDVLRKHVSPRLAQRVQSMRELHRHEPAPVTNMSDAQETHWLASACELIVQRMQSKRVPRPIALGMMRIVQLLLGRQVTSRLLHDVSQSAGDLHMRERTLAHMARFERVTGRATWTARWQRVASQLHLLRHGYDCPERATGAFIEHRNGAVNRTLMYLHNSQPFFSGGFATRSQGVLTAVREAGYEPLALTRLGFPWDLPGRNDPPPEQLPVPEVIDGISYYRLAPTDNGRFELPVEQYLDASADAVEQFIRRHPVSLVHAASFASTCGLPAMKAARRLGLPFVYEVRGLSYLTKVSRMPEWKGSDEYELDIRLERQAANGADMVFTLTRAMKEELVRIGVDEQKIHVFPNCVDPHRFQPMARNEALATELGMHDCVVIGYIGGFVHYEGLDDLLRAFAKLIKRVKVPLKLLMVGDGNEDQRLRALASELRLGDHVLFTGRLPHSAVADYYSLVDIAPFPRLPIPVCEIVSPMKPFEAMAMEKTVVVSSVRALAEIVQDGQTGLVFKKRDIDDFVNVLQRAVEDAALRRQIGKAARQWVIEHRTWSTISRQVSEVYGALLHSHSPVSR